MSYKIKFGTDGWRGIIAREFTVENVERVAVATAQWLNENYKNPSVVLGFDCRFGGEMFSETVAAVLASCNIKVFLAKDFVSTPMISLGTVKLNASMGVIITASHNPPSYNGYKLKAHYGGPASPKVVEDIENMIPDNFSGQTQNIQTLLNEGKVEYVDLETMYCDHVYENFDIEAIKNSKLVFAYDAMYGAGRNVMKRLFPDITSIHCDNNPGFDGQAPEPIHKNLTELSELIRISEDIDCGLATDGDADRLGLYNNKGEFIDSHHIILLLINYLHKNKGFTGTVVNSFSCTQKIVKLCNLYNLGQITTKIGFKYICEYMVNQDVLVGGEESGGIAIKGHIPERDGIWMGLTIWEYMAKTGKSLNDLIQEVYDLVGSFAVERNDLHIEEELKQKIVENCRNSNYKTFGNYTVEKLETTDGYKFHLGNDEWVMIRPSGTEPVLRIYAESSTKENANDILKATETTILNDVMVSA